MPNRSRVWNRRKKPKFIQRQRLRKPKVPVVLNKMKWEEKAYSAGSYAGTTSSNDVETNLHWKVNRYWSQWYSSIQRLPWTMYHQAANQFIAGYCRQTGQHANKWVLIPTIKSVSVIVTVMNEKDTIPSILEQLHRLPLQELIFVLNGSTDESFEIIRNQSSAIIVHYHDPLGHDVGRAVGAKLSQSDILLFLDGDFPIYAEQLVPFVEAVALGMDIALNNITPYIGLFSERDEVTTVKEFVNMSMEREELEANSLTAVPHAMSRYAAEVIGYTNLSVPPKAQVIALNHGLKLGAPIHVDVISRNRIRKRNVGSSNIVSEMIVGDHIEALKAALDIKGSRLQYPDQIRNRGKVSHSEGE
jgi:hypothetical protein